MVNKVKVVLVDDHRMMLDGLRQFIQREQDLAVVGEAATGEAGLQVIEREAPDLVVMDIDLPGINGIEVLRRIVARWPRIRVLILSGYCDPGYVGEAMKHAASGYLLKSNTHEELILALRTILAGKTYLSPEVCTALATQYRAKDGAPAAAELSARETEVLRLIADGRSTKEIAANLGVSIKTIETHRHRIMEKLDVDSVAELTKYAVRRGIASL